MASRKRSKPKGNDYENVVSKYIRTHLLPSYVFYEGEKEEQARRLKVAYNLCQRTGMSGGRTERGDIIVKSPIVERFPYFFECRNRESWSWENIFKKTDESVIIQWFLKDAVGKCHPAEGVHERLPILVFTKNFDHDYVAMWKEDWLTQNIAQGDFLLNIHTEEGMVVILSFWTFLESHTPLEDNDLEGLVFK